MLFHKALQALAKESSEKNKIVNKIFINAHRKEICESIFQVASCKKYAQERKQLPGIIDTLMFRHQNHRVDVVILARRKNKKLVRCTDRVIWYPGLKSGVTET